MFAAGDGHEAGRVKPVDMPTNVIREMEYPSKAF